MFNKPVRSLSFESLEHRAMLSGTVQVTFKNGLLGFLGDSAGNTVAVTPSKTTAGTVSVVINGGAAKSYAGVTGISGVMQGGNNTVTIGLSGVAKPFVLKYGVTVTTGNGTDTITISNISATACAVTAGPGANVVSLNTCAFADAYVYLGAYPSSTGTVPDDNNTLNLKNAAITSGILNGGGGNNDVLNNTHSVLGSAVQVVGFSARRPPAVRQGRPTRPTPPSP